MSTTNIYNYVGIILAVILTPVLSRSFNLSAQTHTSTTPDTRRLPDAYMLSSARIIENVGQFPPEIRFVAPYYGGWILFLPDRVEYRRRISQCNEHERQNDAYSTIPFMSRKSQSTDEYVEPTTNNSVADTVILFNDTTVLEGLGLRTERVHYFTKRDPCSNATDAPTWDTIQCTSHDMIIMFYFHNGVLVMKYGNTTPFEFDINLGTGMTTSTAFTGYIYSSYLGGSAADGIKTVIPIDQTKFLLVGTTHSFDFPIVGNSYSTKLRGHPTSIYTQDVHVTCLDVQRNEILFSTYFGGWDLESLMAAEIDASGNILFAGTTWSDDLPVTANAWQSQYSGNGDGYIAALNSTGSELVFCSYIGGSGVENLKDMKIDAHGDIVITGLTDSWNYPTTPGVVQNRYGGGDDDIIVTKFNLDASELVFSTFIGGEGWDEGRSLNFTPDGNILVAGYTNSNDFPVTQDALYGSRVGGDEGCVFILTPGGRRLVYASYLAWDTHEDAREASLNVNGVMTVFGITTSANLPVNETSYQRQKGETPAFNPASEDFYVLKYQLADGKILSCTYLGGSGRERYPRSIISMNNGDILVSGGSNSRDFPLTVPGIVTSPNVYAGTISYLQSTLSDVKMSIDIGGADDTYIENTFVINNDLVVSGVTYAPDFPITAGAYQSELMGASDAFFTIIDLSSVLSTFAPPLAPATTDIEAYPQPAGATLRLVQRLDPAAVATVTLHDCLGRLQRRTSFQAGSDGMLRVQFEVADLRPGVYDCRITADNRCSRRLVSIVH
jgi:hypothetical protein